MAQPPPDERRCHGQMRNGERCTQRSLKNGEFCKIHDPEQDWNPGLPPDDRRCTATATGGTTRPERKGERCDAWAMKGQRVCRAHGGSVPKNKIAGLRRVAEAELEVRAAHLIGTPVENPLTELASLAGRARAWMELMQGRIEKLLEASEGPPQTDDGGIRYRSGTGEQLRAEVALYERSMDRLGKFLADYGRLNIDERLAAITSNQAERVVASIEAALAAAGVHDKALIASAKQAAARRLRAVS